MSFDPNGYALSAEDGTAVWFLDTRMTVKASGDQTNGAFTFLEWAAPAGFGPPPHRHDREDEAFYLIEGAIEVSCGDQRWEVGPGGFVFLPRGIPHSFVVSAGPVRGLQITRARRVRTVHQRTGHPGTRARAASAISPRRPAADRGVGQIRLRDPRPAACLKQNRDTAAPRPCSTSEIRLRV